VAAVANVDRKRVYIFGHGNGGFMAYRLACDHSEKITGIAVLGGATFYNKADCQATSRVNVLHIHGTEDKITLYDGGISANAVPYPSVSSTLSSWTAINKCQANSFQNLENPFNLDKSIKGDNTISYVAICPPGGDVTFWVMQGSGHFPQL